MVQVFETRSLIPTAGEVDGIVAGRVDAYTRMVLELGAELLLRDLWRVSTQI